MKEKIQARKKVSGLSGQKDKAKSGNPEKLQDDPERKKHKHKKNTSLRLDKATLKALKIKAIEQDSSVQKLIESLIHDYLHKNP